MDINIFVFIYLFILAVDLSYLTLFSCMPIFVSCIGVKSLVFVNIPENKLDYDCYLLKDTDCEFTIGA